MLLGGMFQMLSHCSGIVVHLLIFAFSILTILLFLYFNIFRYELTEYGKSLAQQHGVQYEANGLVDHKIVQVLLRKAKINR